MVSTEASWSSRFKVLKSAFNDLNRPTNSVVFVFFFFWCTKRFFHTYLNSILRVLKLACFLKMPGKSSRKTCVAGLLIFNAEFLQLSVRLIKVSQQEIVFKGKIPRSCAPIFKGGVKFGQKCCSERRQWAGFLEILYSYYDNTPSIVFDTGRWFFFFFLHWFSRIFHH